MKRMSFGAIFFMQCRKEGGDLGSAGLCGMLERRR
jgi:hypothetical protein